VVKLVPRKRTIDTRRRETDHVLAKTRQQESLSGEKSIFVGDHYPKGGWGVLEILKKTRLGSLGVLR